MTKVYSVKNDLEGMIRDIDSVVKNSVMIQHKVSSKRDSLEKKINEIIQSLYDSNHNFNEWQNGKVKTLITDIYDIYDEHLSQVKKNLENNPSKIEEIKINNQKIKSLNNSLSDLYQILLKDDPIKEALKIVDKFGYKNFVISDENELLTPPSSKFSLKYIFSDKEHKKIWNQISLFKKNFNLDFISQLVKLNNIKKDISDIESKVYNLEQKNGLLLSQEKIFNHNQQRLSLLSNKERYIDNQFLGKMLNEKIQDIFSWIYGLYPSDKDKSEEIVKHIVSMKTKINGFDRIHGNNLQYYTAMSKVRSDLHHSLMKLQRANSYLDIRMDTYPIKKNVEKSLKQFKDILKHSNISYENLEKLDFSQINKEIDMALSKSKRDFYTYTSSDDFSTNFFLYFLLFSLLTDSVSSQISFGFNLDLFNELNNPPSYNPNIDISSSIPNIDYPIPNIDSSIPSMDFSMPSIDTPSIDIPSFDTSSFDSSSSFDMGSGSSW